MKKVILSFVIPLAMFSLAAVFINSQSAEAQTVVCPAGYTCTVAATSTYAVVSNASTVVSTGTMLPNRPFINYYVSFKFTVTAGNNPVYISKNVDTLNPVIFTEYNGNIAPISMGISADGYVMGDGAGYYYIPSGSSRSLTLETKANSDTTDGGVNSIKVAGIRYGLNPSALGTNIITSGLGNLTAKLDFLGMTRPATAGWIAFSLQRSPADGTVIANGNSADVATYRLMATGSDMTSKSLSLDFDTRLWLYASAVTLTDDTGTIVASKNNLSASDFSEIVVGSDYQLSMPINVVTPRGSSRYLTVRVAIRPTTDRSNTNITIIQTALRSNDKNGISDLEIDMSKRMFKFVNAPVTPINSPVITGLMAPTFLNVGQSGTWTINAYDPANGSLGYMVNWGESGIGLLSMPAYTQTTTFTHVYQNPGNYRVSFVVRNSNGATASTSATVQVGNGGAITPVCPVGYNCTTNQVTGNLDASSPVSRTVQVSSTAQTDNVVLAVFDLNSNKVDSYLRSIKIPVSTSKQPTSRIFTDIKLRINGNTYSASTIEEYGAQRAGFTNLNVALPADVYVPVTVIGKVAADRGLNDVSGSSVAVTLVSNHFNENIIVEDLNGKRVSVADFEIRSATTTLVGGTLMISNASLIKDTYLTNQSGYEQYLFTMKFTLTAGNNPIYIGTTASTNATATIQFTDRKGSIVPKYITSGTATSNGDSVRYDKYDYYYIAPGATRQFVFGGKFTGYSDDFYSQVIAINYGTSTSNLSSNSITYGLENLYTSFSFIGNRPNTPVCPVGYICSTYGTSTPIMATTTPVSNNSCYQFNVNLTLGDSGADVVALQTFLLANGYSLPSISSGRIPKGSFNEETRQAVMKYQANKAIPSTGFVGPMTRSSINICAHVVSTPTGVSQPVVCPAGYTCNTSATTTAPRPTYAPTPASTPTPVVCPVGYTCNTSASTTPSVTVFSPNGGEFIQLPGGFDIAFKPNPGQRHSFVLVNDATDRHYQLVPIGASGGTIIGNSTNRQVVFTGIPSEYNLPSGSKYKIEICGGTSCDRSDNYFTIAAPNISPAPTPYYSATPVPYYSASPVAPTYSPTPAVTAIPTPRPTTIPTPVSTYSPVPTPTYSPAATVRATPAATYSPAPSISASPRPSTSPSAMMSDQSDQTASVWSAVWDAVNAWNVSNR